MAPNGFAHFATLVVAALLPHQVATPSPDTGAALF